MKRRANKPQISPVCRSRALGKNRPPDYSTMKITRRQHQRAQGLQINYQSDMLFCFSHRTVAGTPGAELSKGRGGGQLVPHNCRR
jgi:hypothetical protein